MTQRLDRTLPPPAVAAVATADARPPPEARARRGGAGEIIRFGAADCDFGRLLIGATAAGLCFIGFAEPDAALAADLRHRFPRAGLVRDDAGLAATLVAVQGAIAAPAVADRLPLDLRGTAFQLRVWQALRRIPPGETRSYGELAAMAGRPGAARAAGRACGLNPVAPAVPCHRAVAADGALTGYRWGIACKAALLARERAGRIEASHAGPVREGLPPDPAR